jgi:hypothetical protein
VLSGDVGKETTEMGTLKIEETYQPLVALRVNIIGARQSPARLEQVPDLPLDRSETKTGSCEMRVLT